MTNLQQKPQIPRALTEMEAAAYISMSRSFLAQSRMENHCHERVPAPPHIKIGRAVRYLREDLDKWLDSFSKSELGGEHA